MVKVSFVSTVSILTLIQVNQVRLIISALFGSCGGAWLMCMWVVTSGCRSSVGLGSRPGINDIGGPVQQSSPLPAAVGAPPYLPMYGLWYDRTRVLEVIPNTGDWPGTSAMASAFAVAAGRLSWGRASFVFYCPVWRARLDHRRLRPDWRASAAWLTGECWSCCLHNRVQINRAGKAMFHRKPNTRLRAMVAKHMSRPYRARLVWSVGRGVPYLMHMAASVMAILARAIYIVTAIVSSSYFEDNAKPITLGLLTLTWVWFQS